jgi:adhesin transport system outer membrane protein
LSFCAAFTALATDAAERAPANSQNGAPEGRSPDQPWTLRDSIEATLRNHPTVKAFQEYRQSAEHDLARSRNGFYPNVTVRAGVGLEQWEDVTTRNPNYSEDKHKFYPRSDAALVLTQNIWDGLATASRRDMAKFTLASAEYRLIDNAEVLSLEAVLSHIEVIRQKQLLTLAEGNVRSHQAILESQMEREAAGVSNLSDVSQTRSRLSRAESTLAQTKMDLNNSFTRYRIITGRIPENLEAPSAPGYSYPSLENALATSMTSSSKVLSKRSDVETSYAQKEFSKSAFHPRIYLEAGPSYSYRVQSSHTDSWGTAVQVRADWNLFNGGYDLNMLRGDKARIRQSNRELQALRDELAQQTAVTWAEWQTARELNIFYADSVLYSSQTRDMYLEQFNVGQRSLLDVLDAENELFSNSLQLITSQLNETATQYRLLTLGGKLFNYFGINKEQLKPATNDDDFSNDDLTGTTVNNHAFLQDDRLDPQRLAPFTPKLVKP